MCSFLQQYSLNASLVRHWLTLGIQRWIETHCSQVVWNLFAIEKLKIIFCAHSFFAMSKLKLLLAYPYCLRKYNPNVFFLGLMIAKRMMCSLWTDAEMTKWTQRCQESIGFRDNVKWAIEWSTESQMPTPKLKMQMINKFIPFIKLPSFLLWFQIKILLFCIIFFLSTMLYHHHISIKIATISFLFILFNDPF